MGHSGRFMQGLGSEVAESCTAHPFMRIPHRLNGDLGSLGFSRNKKPMWGSWKGRGVGSLEEWRVPGTKHDSESQDLAAASR